MTYYGQFDPPTDRVIEEYFPSKTSGVAVEVGAAQGIAASNTLHFEQLGWKCLCIEPNPHLFSSLIVARKYILNYAIGDVNADNIDFHVCRGDETAVSALYLDEKLLKDNNVSGFYTIKVKVRTLDFCIEQFYHNIDFISIDTEGTELDVLKGFSVEKYKPKLFVIENNYNKPEIENYLKIFGYKKDKRYIINDFYTRE